MRAFVALIFQFILRGLVRNKVRSILTVLGIALGVAVMLAINLANSSALSKFSESIDLVSGKTTLSIVARTDADLSQSVLQKLSWLYDEEIKFTPVIDQIIVSAKPPNEVAQLLGVDIFADKQFRQLNTGLAPDGGGGFEIFRRGRVFVGSELARRQNLKSGGIFNLFINDKEVPCTVAGVLSGEGLGKAFAGNIVIMDISCAQDLLNMGDRITRIDLIVPSDRIDEVSNRIAKDLPPSAAVERPQRRGQQVEKMLRSFQYNLTALSLIALLVGMFLIYNTMSISVIRRRWEIGTMRALGASVNTVFLLFISEAAILGVLGSALGVAGGLFFARFTVAAVSRTVQALYADQPAGAIIVEPATLLIAFIAGTALTILAAMAPAFEAVSIPPAEAARRSSYEQKVQRLSPVLAGIGAVLLLIALVASFQEAVGGFPFYGYLAASLSVFGFAAMTPLFLDFILRMLAPLLAKIMGTEARLAALSLHGALGRTSVAVASLMVGIAMMVSLAVMIGSFRNTVNTWVNQTLRADLWLEPAGRNVSNRAGRLTPEVVNTIRKVPDIDAVDAFIEFPIEYNGSPANFGAGELDVMIKHGNLLFVNGEPSATVLRRVAGKNAGIVSESFALRHKVGTGDVLTLQSPSGSFPIRVEGIYYDYSSDSGFIIVPRETFAKYYKDRNSTTLAIFLKENADVEKVRLNIFASLPADTRLNIRTNRELKLQVLKIFDNTFSITYALHAISIAVAILGVMNALFALTMESRKDLGIFKYLGASKQQLGKLVIVQAGLLGTLGNLGGLAMGMILSLLLIYVINKQSFGWTIQFFLPLDFLLQSFALIFVCSVLSGIIPARLAEKTPAAEVVRSE